MKKTILITGSSRGIGKAIAYKFAQNNFDIVLHYGHDQEKAKMVFDDLKQKFPGNHSLICANLSSVTSIRDMFSEINKTYGKLDVLINNAGTTKFIPHQNLADLTEEIFDELYAVNLKAAFFCAAEAQKLMGSSSDPCIINIASIAATTANGSNIAYCALKSALVNMTKSMARALGPKIRVNSISPGLIETELTKSWKEYANEQIAKSALKKLAMPEDIAEVSWSLCSHMKMVTGQDLIVDGGRVIN